MNQDNLQLFKDRKLKANSIFRINPINNAIAYNFVKQYHYLGEAKFFAMYAFGLYERERVISL